jgi:hypothetical protein
LAQQGASERFKRLLQSPWDAAEAAESNARGTSAPQLALLGASGDGDSDGNRGGDEDGEQDDTPARDPRAQPVQPDPALTAFGFAPTHVADFSHDRPRGQSAEATGASSLPSWLEGPLAMASWVCVHAAALGRSWTAEVPLDADVLPRSALKLTLSPHTLALRFRLGNAEATALVSTHVEILRAQLQALPDAPPDITIDWE